MATPAENLSSAYSNICQQLADITANPKPSYSADGESISWGEHFNNLTNQLKVIREQMQKAAGPFEVYS